MHAESRISGEEIGGAVGGDGALEPFLELPQISAVSDAAAVSFADVKAAGFEHVED